MGLNIVMEEACAASLLLVSTWLVLKHLCVFFLLLFYSVSKFQVGNLVRFVL